jgi:hypothetical protein
MSPLAILLAGSVFAAGGSAAQETPAPERPNILFILRDNLGYGEVGVYGGGITRGAPTPELAVHDLEQRRLIDAEITRRSVDFMRRSVEADRRFYAYVPYTLMHFPSLPNPAFAGRTGHGDFPDALAEMDCQRRDAARRGRGARDRRRHDRRLHQRQRAGGDLAADLARARRQEVRPDEPVGRKSYQTVSRAGLRPRGRP